MTIASYGTTARMDMGFIDKIKDKNPPIQPICSDSKLSLNIQGPHYTRHY